MKYYNNHNSSFVWRCLVILPLWMTWMTDTRHLLGLWLHHVNQDNPSRLGQMLRQQLDEPSIYPQCLLHQLLLEVDKGWCTATRTRWWHRLDHTLDTLYHVWPKKAVEALSTIRTVLNDCSDVHAVVVWIVSGIKELLHLPNQLLPVTIHQTVSTCLLILHVKEALTAKDVHVWRSLFMWSTTRLRFNSGGSLVTNPSTVE